MSIRNKLLAVEGIALSLTGILLYLSNREKEDWMRKRDSAQRYYDTVFRWMMNESEGMRLDQTLHEQGIQKVAIYGYGKLGELLYKKLQKIGVKISYIADVNKLLGLDPEINVPTFTPDRMGEAPEADIIIVTPVNDYDAIVKQIRDKGVETKCISLDGLVMNSLS